MDVHRNEHGTVVADWANMFAQVSVREGVQIAFLQKIHRIVHSTHLSGGAKVFELQGILTEWDRWFRNV